MRRPTTCTPPSLKRVEIEVASVVVADELHRGVPPGAFDVVDLVVALVELADAVHPPVDVTAPIGTRQPDVLADRDRHRRDRLRPQLVGDLHAGRRRADHQHLAARGELRRTPVLQRRELVDVAGQVRRERGTRGSLDAPVAATTASHCQCPRSAATSNPSARAAHRLDRDPGEHRGIEVPAVVVEERDRVRRGHEPVGSSPS